MAPHSARWLIVALAVAGLAADQVSKYAVFRNLAPQAIDGMHGMGFSEYPLIGNVFSLLAQYKDKEVGDGLFAPLQRLNGDRLPHVNIGALFGVKVSELLGYRERPEGVDNAFFLIVSVVAALAIAYWGSRPTTANDTLLCISLGLIMAGTLGNLYDRIVFGGVRDFLYFRIQGVIDWPVFNIADCCLVVGAGILVVQAFVLPPAPKTAEVKPAL